MNLRHYLNVHYWVARWMDRAFARRQARQKN